MPPVRAPVTRSSGESDGEAVRNVENRGSNCEDENEEERERRDSAKRYVRARAGRQKEGSARKRKREQGGRGTRKWSGRTVPRRGW